MTTPKVPGSDEVWRRVVAYAKDCLRNDQPVFTVARRIRNRIKDVKQRSIGRFSAQGTSNSSRVTRAMVENLWSEIRGEGGGPSYLYFTKALVLAALPGIVEDMDGKLVLRHAPSVLESKQRRMAAACDSGTGVAGG